MARPASSRGRLVTMNVLEYFKVVPLGSLCEIARYGSRDGASVRYRSNAKCASAQTGFAAAARLAGHPIEATPGIAVQRAPITNRLLDRLPAKERGQVLAACEPVEL